jgi:hypothetical protein
MQQNVNRIPMATAVNELIYVHGNHEPNQHLPGYLAPFAGIESLTVELPQARLSDPAESTLAPHATVAQNVPSPWHGATVAPHAAVAPYAVVRGELRVPNTINFNLFPTLDPFARAVYYQLFLLSHGFHRDPGNGCPENIGKNQQLQVFRTGDCGGYGCPQPGLAEEAAGENHTKNPR